MNLLKRPRRDSDRRREQTSATDKKINGTAAKNKSLPTGCMNAQCTFFPFQFKAAYARNMIRRAYPTSSAKGMRPNGFTVTKYVIFPERCDFVVATEMEGNFDEGAVALIYPINE